jgi:prepilin-type N-terminal cleavage/methylation domain-containing protein
MTKTAAFTLIELLVVIAIIAILAVVVVLTLNPAQLLAQSRDANRLSDMATLTSAISLYQTDVSTGGIGTQSVVYTSLPDTASSTCGDLGLLILPSGYSYHCATQANLRLASSSGWIPLNFQNISSGAPFGSLPIDPTNSSSSRLYYTYDTNGSQFEVTAAMESAKYKLGGSNDIISSDGGTLASVYEKGTKVGLEPLDYGDPSLIGYWPLNEGANAVAYDESGNGDNGAWQGTPGGSGGTYYAQGYTQSSAAYFTGLIGNYIVISSTTSLLGMSAITETAWVYNPLYVTSSPPIDIGVTACCSYDYAFDFQDNSDNAALWNVLSASNRYTVGILSPTSTWQFMVGTFTGTQISYYQNGRLVAGPLAASVAYTPRSFYIGEDVGGFNGTPYDISNVRVYNRVLSAAEIQALYNAGK